MPSDLARPRPAHRTRLPVILAVIVCSAVGAMAARASLFGRPHVEKRLSVALTRSLPGVTVSAVDCRAASAPKGFCEFVAGRNVFYATPDARYVLVGQVLDLTRKVDLTERRRAEIRGLASAADVISGAAPSLTPSPPSQAAAAPGAPPPRLQVLKVAPPAANAIVHNRGAPLKMTVFTDFNCHFCRQLFEGLKAEKQIEVTEYPIAILGADSSTKAAAVLCAADRVAASEGLYAGRPVAGRGDCADGARQLQENLQFARANGINGTPMIVRADGATNAGWMPQDQLVAWLRQAAPAARGGV